MKKFFKGLYAIVAGVLGGMFIMLVIVLLSAWLVNMIAPNMSETVANVVLIVVPTISIIIGVVGGVYVGLHWYDK